MESTATGSRWQPRLDGERQPAFQGPGLLCRRRMQSETDVVMATQWCESLRAAGQGTWER